ncbi:MAG TPA: hypothetical protein VKA47_07685 [Solirubrobacterales bacterium]|nr:hypothetical protein [Solirubrobacterales bacterium]
MTRTRAIPAEKRFELDLALLIGPVEGDGLTDEEMEAGWEIYGDELMRDYRGLLGTRLWGWWRFVVGEEAPRGKFAEPTRLAELGQLTDEEIAVIAERANEARTRIGTDAQRGTLTAAGWTGGDLDDVELWGRIEEVMKR